nr:reverse transcriptase domain-containing protein [Tanacetum cinerariifolium]
MRLDVFSASVVSKIYCVLCRLWFIFHHLRKKRRRGWNLRLKNPPLKHLVFEGQKLDRQEPVLIVPLNILVFRNWRKTRRSNLIRHHQRTIAGISLVVVNCGGLRYKFLNGVTCMQARSSSRIVSNPSSNPTPSTNPNLKGRNRRLSEQRIEDFNLEELSPPIVTMADQCTMAQLLQVPTEGYEDAIVVPAITTDNFELKHSLLTLVQNKKFFGHDKEDPHAHIRYFNKITSTLKFPNILNT